MTAHGTSSVRLPGSLPVYQSAPDSRSESRPPRPQSEGWRGRGAVCVFHGAAPQMGQNPASPACGTLLYHSVCSSCASCGSIRDRDSSYIPSVPPVSCGTSPACRRSRPVPPCEQRKRRSTSSMPPHALPCPDCADTGSSGKGSGSRHSSQSSRLPEAGCSRSGAYSPPASAAESSRPPTSSRVRCS